MTANEELKEKIGKAFDEVLGLAVFEDGDYPEVILDEHSYVVEDMRGMLAQVALDVMLAELQKRDIEKKKGVKE